MSCKPLSREASLLSIHWKMSTGVSCRIFNGSPEENGMNKAAHEIHVPVKVLTLTRFIIPPKQWTALQKAVI